MKKSNIINIWFDFDEMLDKKFKYGKKISKAIDIAITMLFLIVAGGWLIAYDRMTSDDDSWTKSDDIMHYSGMMFLIVFVGAAIEAMILAGLFGLLFAILLVCWHGWFIILPLFVVFLGICFGHWLHLMKAKHSVCNRS